MEEKKIMVIAPHADDEVLGCGGYLLHNKGCQILIVIATIGGKDKRQHYDTRIREFSNVCDELGAKGVVLYQDKDAELDTVSSFKLTTKLDKWIDSFKPTEIFINALSRHQDHIKLYNCAMASLRLREGYSPEKVFLYEYPFSVQTYNRPNGGKVYHDITDVIDKKVELFELYSSQVKSSPSPLNEHGIKTLAAIRGLECGCDYMEMFYLQKMVL